MGALITEVAAGYIINLFDETFVFIFVFGIALFVFLCFEFCFGMILCFVRFVKRRFKK